MSKYIGFLLMLVFAGIALYRYFTSELIYFLLLFFRDILFCFYFLRRENTQVVEKSIVKNIAYLSMFLPLLYFGLATENILFIEIGFFLTIIGFLISTLALIDLGSSIGISPAKRTKISSGIYKYLKHPMYTGYIITEFGMVLINILNLPVFVVSVVLYMYRAKIENRILNSATG